MSTTPKTPTVEEQLIQICTDIYYECDTIKKLDELTDKALAILASATKEAEKKAERAAIGNLASVIVASLEQKGADETLKFAENLSKVFEPATLTPNDTEEE
jgi:hypothetical protein